MSGPVRFFVLAKSTVVSISMQKKKRPQTRIVAGNSAPVCKRNVFSHPEGIPRSNCYAYALGLGRRRGPYYKLQPGDLSSKKPFGLASCKDVRQRTLEDLDIVGGFETEITAKCTPGYYKIALILSKNMDYHYLILHKDVIYVAERGDTRQSIAEKFSVRVQCVERRASYAPGTSVYIKNAHIWSHKRGAAYAPSLLDARGKIIHDPRTASFDYGMLNYSTYCTSFCVRSRPGQEPCTVRNSRCAKTQRTNLIVSSKKSGPLRTIDDVIDDLKQRVIQTNTAERRKSAMRKKSAPRKKSSAKK